MPQTDDQKRADQESDARRSFFYQLAHYSHIAIVLPAAVFVGWVIGALLDRWLHTHWLYIVGVFVGIIAGFVDLIRTATAASKDTQ